MAKEKNELSADEKAARMWHRVTGQGEQIATVAVGKLPSHERAALVEAHDDNENTPRAKQVIDHAATRESLQDRERAVKPSEKAAESESPATPKKPA